MKGTNNWRHCPLCKYRINKEEWSLKQWLQLQEDIKRYVKYAKREEQITK